MLSLLSAFDLLVEKSQVMVMRTSALVFFFGLLSVSVFAQEDENSSSDISTDRPTQTTSPYIVQPGAFQIETGFYQQSTSLFVPNGIGAVEVDFQAIVYNTLLLRYGLSDRLELRLNQELGRSRMRNGGTILEQSNVSFGPTTIGLKYGLLKEEGWRPEMAVTAHVGGPILSDGRGVVGDVRMNFQHNISDKFNVSYNLGIAFIENAQNMAVWTLNLGYVLSPRLSAFLEGYGSAERFTSQQSFDFGITYLVTSNFQLDFYGGVGVSDFAPDTLFGFGLSTKIFKN